MDQAFSRPRFFAGQLLTEDDLGALADYVTQKNRLHNRALFGEGVVCGLDVVCSPCGGGKVTVQPGYALDCCGNDIVISCPKEIDINQLIRELRAALRGGVDCGDPCPPPETTTAPPPPPPPPTPAPPPSSAGGEILTGVQPVKVLTPSRQIETRHQPSPTQRTYCLFVRYIEEPTDLVSPFATDDSCSTAQSCEPTRIREGWRFELRCKQDCKTPDDLFWRIVDCLGDLVKSEKNARDASGLTKAAAELRTANAAIDAAPAFDVNNAPLAQAPGALAGLNGLLGNQQNPPAKWSQSDVTQALANVMILGRIVAARHFANQTQQDMIDKALGGLGGVRTVLSNTQSAFNSDPNPLGQLDSMLRIRDCLEEGRFVGMLADRSFDDNPGQRVPFLGEPAVFPTGPMRAAAALRRPVIFMAGLYRGGNRYRVVFRPLADFSQPGPLTRELAVGAAIERYVALLEEYCRSEPYNWFNFYDFWGEDA